MNYVYKGIFFILLNFSINIGTCKIGLIPTFVGYHYLIQGFLEMRNKSEWFTKGTRLMDIMVPVSAVAYLLDLFGIGIGVGSYLLELIMVVSSMYMTKICIMGMFDLERVCFRDLGAARLRHCWNVLAVFYAITYLLRLNPLTGGLIFIVPFIVSIVLVIGFKESRNRYYGTGFF